MSHLERNTRNRPTACLTPGRVKKAPHPHRAIAEAPPPLEGVQHYAPLRDKTVGNTRRTITGKEVHLGSGAQRPRRHHTLLEVLQEFCEGLVEDFTEEGEVETTEERRALIVAGMGTLGRFAKRERIRRGELPAPSTMTTLDVCGYCGSSRPLMVGKGGRHVCPDCGKI